jgi:hypothetical protein
MNILGSHRNKSSDNIKIKLWFSNLTQVGMVRAVRFENSCHGDMETLKNMSNE